MAAPPYSGGYERPTQHHYYPQAPSNMDVPQLEQMIVEAIHDRLQEWVPFPSASAPPPPPPPARDRDREREQRERDRERERDRDRYYARPPPPPPSMKPPPPPPPQLKVPHYAGGEYEASHSPTAYTTHEQYYAFSKTDAPASGFSPASVMGILTQMMDQMVALTDQVNGLARSVDRLERQQRTLAEALDAAGITSSVGDSEHHYHHVQRHVHHFHDVHIIGSADETVDLSTAPQTVTKVIPPEDGTPAENALPSLNVDPQHLGKWAMTTRPGGPAGSTRPASPPSEFGPPLRAPQS